MLLKLVPVNLRGGEFEPQGLKPISKHLNGTAEAVP